MKRRSIYCAVAIATALVLGVMAGCSSQPASSASASSDSSTSASASGAAEKSQDEIIAELKDSLANVPSYESITILEKSLSWANSGADAASSASAAAASDEITAETLYKFDMSGDKLKTFAAFKLADIQLQYYSDGDDAVCVTDGPVYSGTVEQFGLSHAAGADAYLKSTIGDLNAAVECVTSISQDEINGVMGYELILDAEKYAEFDEGLKIAADAGDPVQEVYITVGIDKEGKIVWLTRTFVFSKVTSSVLLDLMDFNDTVIDPMPEATNTYEEMEADEQMKFDELAAEMEADEKSADATEAK